MMNLTIWDKLKGKPVDVDDLKDEDWVQNSNVLPMDLENFAVTEDGQVLLIDTCGNYTMLDGNRFYAMAGFMLIGDD